MDDGHFVDKPECDYDGNMDAIDCPVVGIHTVFAGANLGHGCALNGVEPQPTMLNGSVFPAVSLFPQVKGLCPPHWQ